MRLIRKDDNGSSLTINVTELRLLDAIVGGMYVTYLIQKGWDEGDGQLLFLVFEDAKSESSVDIHNLYGTEGLPLRVIYDTHKQGFGKNIEASISSLSFQYSHIEKDRLIECLIMFDDNSRISLKNFSLSMGRILNYMFEGKI